MLNKIMNKIVKSFQPKCIGIFSSFGFGEQTTYLFWFPLSGIVELKHQYMSKEVIKEISTIYSTD